MKRIGLIGILVGVSIVCAAQASAVAVFFGAPSVTNLTVGETVEVTYRLDTEGETQVTSVFASTFVDPAVLQFVSGTSPGQILFNTSTFEGVARVSQPVTGVPGDPPGQVRAANFATANPTGSGVASANQLLATLTFMAVGPGAVQVQAVLNVGDDEVTVATVSVTGSVGSTDSATITVPEPTGGALSLVALGSVVWLRRRQLLG